MTVFVFHKYDLTLTNLILSRSRQLASVRCVPVERPSLYMTGPGQNNGSSTSSYGNGGPSPNRQYQFVSFAEACPTKDRNLVWSVAPVLLAPHVPPQLSWSGLGIVSNPPRELVVQHLINLCTEQSTTEVRGQKDIDEYAWTRKSLMCLYISLSQARGAVEANSLLATGGSEGSVLDRWVYGETPVMVFQSIYRYLEENWATIPAATKITIKGTCVSERLAFHAARRFMLPSSKLIIFFSH